jgi:uncharacterized membrane protein YvbJ
MFLEKCKDCGKKVSIRAKFCPKCGVPAPTSVYSKTHPKCIYEDCYEYAETHGKKFKGQCAKHYAQYIDKTSLMVGVIILIAVIVIGIS